MDYSNVYDAVSEDYGPKCGLAVCQVLAIAMSTKIKKKDLSKKGRYSRRIEKKVKAALWETNEGVLDVAIECFHVVNDWSIGISMEGLGGCQVKTFRELVEGAREIKNASSADTMRK